MHVEIQFKVFALHHEFVSCYFDDPFSDFSISEKVIVNLKLSENRYI